LEFILGLLTEVALTRTYTSVI